MQYTLFCIKNEKRYLLMCGSYNDCCAVVNICFDNRSPSVTLNGFDIEDENGCTIAMWRY